MRKAVGCHVFAGGFSMGMRDTFTVLGQLEKHNFGYETVINRLGLPVWHGEWPDLEVDVVYGNPRCSAFSSMTSKCGSVSRGPWAYQCQDIHDLVEYGLRIKAPIIVWESVQQARTVGKLLIEYLVKEKFAPAGYRIAHILENSSTFGNPQIRRRYFFVAYRADLKFNIVVPTLPSRHATIRDAIGHLNDVPTRRNMIWRKKSVYEPDDWYIDDKGLAIVKELSKGESLYDFARRRPDRLKEVAPDVYWSWQHAKSDIPFGIHTYYRMRWDDPCPTITSSSGCLIHPEHDRNLTVRELAALMGWDAEITPDGPLPVAQIAKGVIPDVGRWLAVQLQMCLNGDWGNEDWESSWDPRLQRWVGRDYTGKNPPLEKVFQLTKYVPPRVKC